MKRLCPSCFTELSAEANYCSMCGKCVRDIVEQTKQFIGGPEEASVVGIADSAIRVEE